MRLIAVAFALQAFRAHPATTDARLRLTARLATVTAGRIRAHLAYALSQENNHGISESLGLYTAGALWPQLAHAPAWRDQGLETLFPQVEALVDPEDGGFSQHSTNYHRLFLQLMTCAETGIGPMSNKAASSHGPADGRSPRKSAWAATRAGRKSWAGRPLSGKRFALSSAP